MRFKFNLIPCNWEFLKEELYSPFENLNSVEEFLKLAAGKPNLELKGLELFAHSDLLDIFNFVRMQSLKLEELFPEGNIPILQENVCMILSLSREQVLILLCHMTLLTFKPSSRHVYWVTFENWLTDGRPCAIAYLQGLFSYFLEAMRKINTHWKSEIITFSRKTFSGNIFPLQEVPLNDIEIHLNGGIGDYSRNGIDFANEHIGFGIGGTQEEVLFGSFIELCPAMIFCCDAMKEQESIVIRNVIKYAHYEGYGFSLKFNKKGSIKFESYNVIAIDALDFSADYSNALSLQLQPSNLERELRKLVSGFSSFKNEAIDTGHWGCGAFGGNKCLKAILQMITSSITNNKLSFCCFNDEHFYNSFKSFIEKTSKCTATDMWEALLNIDPSITDLSFEDILKEHQYKN